MKFFFLPFLLFYALYAAEIDTRFFQAETKKAFLEESRQSIAVNAAGEASRLETMLLAKIGQLDGKAVGIAYDEPQIATEGAVGIELFERAFAQCVRAKIEFDETRQKIRQVSSKQAYIKEQILKITAEQKTHLRSYQLQHTMYQLILNRENEKSALLNAYVEKVLEKLQEALPRIDTSLYAGLGASIDTYMGKIGDLEKKSVALNADLEREALLENRDAVKLSVEKEAILMQLDNARRNALSLVIQQAFEELAQQKQKRFYASLKLFNTLIEAVQPHDQNYYQVYYQLLKKMGKEHFGVTSTAFMTSKESLFDTLNYIVELLRAPLFVFNEKAVSSADILKVITIIVLGILAASFYRRRIIRWSQTWSNTSAMTVKLTANSGYYLIIIITLFVSVSSVGIDLTSISMLASALAIGIGFGLQTVVSNLVAGIILMFERSIRIGDYIELTDVLKGTVTDMRIRSTTIKTFDNIDIVVPNSSFIQNNVINLTLDDKTRRLHIPFGVAYGTEVKKVQEAILNELAASELNYVDNDEDKKPVVRMTALGNSSVDYELLVWVEWDNKLKPASFASDFLTLIYNTLYKHGIEIPFPQLDLHVKQMLPG